MIKRELTNTAPHNASPFIKAKYGYRSVGSVTTLPPMIRGVGVNLICNRRCSNPRNCWLYDEESLLVGSSSCSCSSVCCNLSVVAPAATKSTCRPIDKSNNGNTNKGEEDTIFVRLRVYGYTVLLMRKVSFQFIMRMMLDYSSLSMIGSSL